MRRVCELSGKECSLNPVFDGSQLYMHDCARMSLIKKNSDVRAESTGSRGGWMRCFAVVGVLVLSFLSVLLLCCLVSRRSIVFARGGVLRVSWFKGFRTKRGKACCVLIFSTNASLLHFDCQYECKLFKSLLHDRSIEFVPFFSGLDLSSHTLLWGPRGCSSRLGSDTGGSGCLPCARSRIQVV